MCKEIIQQNSPRNQIYTVKEIAQILCISERSAYNFVNKTTEFKVLRVGRCLRVNREVFDTWLQGSVAATN